MNIRVVVTGTQEEITKLKKLGDKLTDFSAANRTMGTELKTYYSETMFGSGGGAGGKQWQALSPAYKRWKGKHYPNKGILVATGTMKKSFRAISTRSSLTIDNTDPKFAYHQMGTGFQGASLVAIARGKTLFKVGGVGPGRGHNLPARPMLVITPAAMDIVKHVIEDDVNKKLESVR